MTSTHTPPQHDTTLSTPSAPAAPRRPRLQLSATQLIASALAAVTATFAASYLGVSGTVIGAAVASVLTVTGNAVYGNSLHRTADRVRLAVPIGVKWLPLADRDGLEHAPTPLTPAKQARTPLTRRHLVIAAFATFTAMLALVTTVELVAGRPLSDLLRGRSGDGTTVFGPPETKTRPTPRPPAPATITQTVIPHVVVTTPTVTQTAPPVTATATPTTTPSTPTPSPTPPSSSPPAS